REFDVAHSKRFRTNEAERKQHGHEHEPFHECEERNAAHSPRRRAGGSGRNDDPVRDPAFAEVALEYGAERGAEQRQPPERHRTRAKHKSAEREGCCTRSGRDQPPGCHGSRGAAVAWAPTVSVETPTSRSRIVGTRRSIST